MEEKNIAENSAPDSDSGNLNLNQGEVGEKPSFSSISIPAAIIVAGIIVAVAIIYSGSGNRQAAPAAPGAPVAAGALAGNVQTGDNQPTSVTDPSGLLSGDDAVLGNPEAKVTLVEFADYQCPFCGKLHKEAMSQIIDNYVKSGKVKFVYKHLAFLGEESVWAAEAAECAKEQGKFWQYHDKLYIYLWDNYYAKNKSGENVGVFSKDNLKKFASELGLNSAQFNQCLDTDKYADRIQADKNTATKYGVQSTPTSFVSGKLILGARPYADFQKEIEDALKNVK